MKNALILFIIFMLTLGSCKKNEETSIEDASLARKYARFNTQVYKDSELKQWLATLAKAEYVDLLEILTLTVKGEKLEIAKVKLSDDSVGYIKMSNLADKPIVFVQDTKVYIRNNITSTVYMTIPRGTIAFIISEKGEWVQIYAGNINGKWLTKQWVNKGFSTDEPLILEARNFEDASAVIDDTSGKKSQEEREQAIQKLRDLAARSEMFGDMARQKLSSFGEQVPASDEELREDTEPDADNSNGQDDTGTTE